MHRSPRLACALAAIVLATVLAPMSTPAPASAAGECGMHRSETVPPPTIRVFRTATGVVEAVDFRRYVKNVLSREWISSWTTESLRSGALAVRNYAWYQVLHWRGYVNASGQCFDVFDSTRDQHYDPARPTYSTMAAAVDATWNTLAHRNGRIFATYYNAGQPFEACGANANGWQMFQWGTQGCGLVGKTAAEIMGIYYPGVIVSAAPPAATPAPTPTATPMPTPVPTPTASATPPPGPAPSVPASAAPTPSPPPAAPAPTPTPAPTLTPSPPAEMPGGGQVGLSAPPLPPPRDPEPIVVTAAVEEVPTVARVASPATRTLPDGHRVLDFERDADADELRRISSSPPTPAVATRWLTVRAIIGYYLTGLLDSWSRFVAQPEDGWLGGVKVESATNNGGRGLTFRR